MDHSAPKNIRYIQYPEFLCLSYHFIDFNWNQRKDLPFHSLLNFWIVASGESHIHSPEEVFNFLNYY